MNGVPLGYDVNVYTSSTGNLLRTSSVSFGTTGLRLDDLIPSTKYTLEVCAYNKVGRGPCQRMENRTLDSGTLENFFLFCCRTTHGTYKCSMSGTDSTQSIPLYSSDIFHDMTRFTQ